MNSRQLIFLQSRANNGAYDGDRLPRKIGIGPRELGFKSVEVICERGNFKYSKG
jgi:hypothetical protein